MAAPQPGQTDDRDFWLSLGEDEKVAFVKGVYTALNTSLQILGAEAARQKSQDPYWVPPFVHQNSAHRLREFYGDPSQTDYLTIARRIDAFYSNPDNAHIDIMYALRILMLHEAGEVQRANELLLIKQKEVLKGR